jgi:hypothetical protein
MQISRFIFGMLFGIIILLLGIFLKRIFISSGNNKVKRKVLFDLSHGQFQDVFVDQSYYNYVLPGYKEICKELGAQYAEINSTIIPKSLEDVKTLV